MSLLRRAFAAVALAVWFNGVARFMGKVPKVARLGGWRPLDLGSDD